MKPNFLIVGAAKCGTTSLYQYLSQHPDIFMPQWKEPSFFIGDPFKPLNSVTKTAYDKLFKKVRHETAIGESSTGYLYDKAAPQLIKNALGHIKVIIMLRDPVAMSYSLYNHQFRKEGESLKTFENALDAEESRRKNSSFKKSCYGWHANYYYYQRALYHRQVKRYLDIFDQNNVFIIIFEDLTDDPLGIAQKAFSFLGVDDAFVPRIEIHNPGGEILQIPKFWRDSGLLLKSISFVFSKNVIKKIPHLLRTVGRKPPSPINPETVQKLRERFHDDICQLEKLIGRDLSAWKKP